MRRAWLGRLDHEIGQQSSYASMNTLGYVKFFRGRVQIEHPQIDPKLHDAESIEYRDFLLQCNPTNVFSICTKGNHRFRARTVLCIDQNDISACRMDNIYTVVEGMAELIWINRLYGVHGSDPPDHERESEAQYR